MQLPEFVGIGEMVHMMAVSKSRVNQLVEREDFPEPYLWLQMGRIWHVNDVIEWGKKTGRRIYTRIPNHRAASPRKAPPRPTPRRIVLARTIPTNTVAKDAVDTNTVNEGAVDKRPVDDGVIGQNSAEVDGRAVNEDVVVEPGEGPGIVTEGCEGDSRGLLYKQGMLSTTISSSREEQAVTPVTTPASSVDNLPTKETPLGVGGVGEGAVPAASPVEDANPTPTRRETMALDRQALADEWDFLEELYLRGPKQALLPDQLVIYPFAIMVIRADGKVPRYRRTRAAIVKAWEVVQQTFEASQDDLADAARHLMDNAQNPFSPGAVKKFSERRIPQAQLDAVRLKQQQQAAPGPNRWQGAHGSHDAAIATWTDEEKKRWGVIPRG